MAISPDLRADPMTTAPETEAAALEDRHPAADVEQRLARVEDYLEAVASVTSWAAEEVKSLGARVGALEKNLNEVAALTTRNHREIARMGPQLAGLEERDDRRRQGALSVAEDVEALPQGGALLEEMRAEHARVRSRLAMVSSYEERIRRLEARR